MELDAWAQLVLQAAIEVHRQLGPGSLEAGRRVGQARFDLLVGERLVVELKAVDPLLPIHRGKVICYRKTTRRDQGCERGTRAVILHALERLASLSGVPSAVID